MEVVMVAMGELALVLVMNLALVLLTNLALVLVMVDQEVYMEVGEGIVAVAVTILTPGRFS